MFPVTRLHISWLKIRDHCDDAVEDKALDKQYEATTTKGRFRSRGVILGQLRVSF